MTIPTQDQIVERIRLIAASDFFGYQTSDMVQYLDFAHAREFLKDEVTEAEWSYTPLTHEHMLSEMVNYMSFAWEKANNERGLSADRSVEHYLSWVWLAGESELYVRLENSRYEYYGKPQLKMICEHFGWDWNLWDNGYWHNSESEPCKEPQ